MAWKKKYEKVKITGNEVTEDEWKEWRDTPSGGPGKPLKLPENIFPKPYQGKEKKTKD